jgi:magnesium transporter
MVLESPSAAPQRRLSVPGWFGTNVPYPGNGEGWGVALMLGLTVALSTAFYVRFRKNGWI